MSETLSIVVAIFGLIGLGYAAARSGLLAASIGQGLTEFVLKVAIPVLLFDTLASADMQGLSPWRVWPAYFAPFAAIWASAHFMIRRLFGRDAAAGIVAGGSAAYSNAVSIGIPLMQATIGEAGMVYLIIIISIHLPTMMLVSLVLNAWTSREGVINRGGTSRRELVRRLALALVTQPILIAILAGLLWRLVGQPLPSSIAVVVAQLGRPAGPLALFASGMALVSFGVARQIGPALAIAGLKLVAMPMLVFAAASAIELPPLGVAAVTLIAACPTGVNAFLVAGRLGTGQALASNVLLISTAGGVLTVTLWLTVLQGMLG